MHKYNNFYDVNDVDSEISHDEITIHPNSNSNDITDAFYCY